MCGNTLNIVSVTSVRMHTRNHSNS